MLGAHSATRSPAATPEAISARAAVWISVRNSEKFQRMSPSTIASRSPKRCAASSISSGIVCQRGSFIAPESSHGYCEFRGSKVSSGRTTSHFSHRTRSRYSASGAVFAPGRDGEQVRSATATRGGGRWMGRLVRCPHQRTRSLLTCLNTTWWRSISESRNRVDGLSYRFRLGDRHVDLVVHRGRYPL